MARKYIAAMLLPLLAIGAPASANVGVASVVNGEPLAKPPADKERILHVGKDMAANEVVTTKANDRAQLVFLDGSTLTVGPNSVITIDKFVYDPDKRTGELTLNAGRGVFRYVGGAISKSSEVTIKTGGATLGIRGGITSFTVAPNGQTTANFLFGGSLTITSQGVTQTTTQAGTQITVPPGAPPTPPAAIPPGSLQQTAQSFQAPPGFTQPGAPSAASIGAALSGSSFGQSNSGMSPQGARSGIPAAQQAQMNVHSSGQGGQGAAPQQGGQGGSQQGGSQQQGSAPQQGGQGSQQASGPQQGSGPLQGGNPVQAVAPGQNPGAQQTAGAQQGAGPLQGGSPLQGAGSGEAQPGSGPLQAAGPLASSGPLQASGPMQAAGPLQNASPLAAATPLQAVGPVQTTMALAGPNSGPMPNIPTVQVANLANGLTRGELGSFQQLQNLLGSEQGRNPETLSSLVNAVSNGPGNSDNRGNRGTNPGPNFPNPPPVVLPPTVYEPKGPSNLSQN